MSITRRTAAFLVVIGVFHWLAGAAFVSALPEKYGTWEHDAMARSLLAGRGFSYRPDGTPSLCRPPLYPVFLSGVYATVGTHWAAVLTVQVLLSVGAVYGVYAIARSRASAGVAWTAAVLAGVYPFHAVSAARRMTEVLFTLLVVLMAKLLTDHVSKPSWRSAAFLGLVGGLATMCRDSFQFFALVLLPVLLLARRPRKAALREWALAAVTWCIVLAPWAWRNYTVSGGSFIPTTNMGAYVVWVGNYAPSLGLDDDGGTPEQLEIMRRGLARVLRDGGFDVTPDDSELLETAFNEPAAHGVLMRDAVRMVTSNPWETAGLAARKAWRFWFGLMGRATYNRRLQPWVTAAQVAYLLPALIGLWFARAKRDMLYGIVSIVLYLWGGHIATTANVRYAVPVMPLVSVFTAFGLEGLAKPFRRRS